MDNVTYPYLSTIEICTLRRPPPGRGSLRAFGILLLIPLLLTAFAATPVGAQLDEDYLPLSVDLEAMDDLLSTRYYISERGEVPIRYILIGGLSLRENFLQYDFDFKEELVEYDELSGNIYTYRTPSYIRFIKRSEREGPYFRYSARPVAEEMVEIRINTLDERVRNLRARSLRSVILEDIRYNLQREREEAAGKGLLSLDIPLPLPKQIERIIGSGDASNLTVQGRESITIGGQSSWCANCPLTEGRPKQQKFPDLEMEQRLTVNLHGNIGEKINVEIQHSSQGEMQSVNRVRLNYKGFDDEIIQLIEMGDTDLILSGAQLISYSGSAKGLFGVKGVAQIGPLDLTVIASKEEGETASGSFTAAGGQSTEYAIPDYNFIKRQYFYFETPGESFTSPNPSFFTVRPVVGGEDGIEVYTSLKKSEWGTTGELEYLISVYPDPENNGLQDTVTVAEGQAKDFTLFRLLREEDGDYQLIQDYTEEGTPIYLGIRLNRTLDSDRMLAVRYKAYDRATDQTFLVGDYDNKTTTNRVAELICPRSDEFGPPVGEIVAPYPSTWNMMMRNVYSLGSTNMEEGSLNIRIEDLSNRPNRDIHEESGISYIRLFGLDRYDRRGLPVKDDQVDDLPWIINTTYGYIMFPWYEAFNPTYGVMTSYFDPPFIDLADSLEAEFDYETLVKDSLIYNAVLTETIKRDGHHYDIVVEATSGQRTFQLSAFDIIEGSEAVTVDGVRLAKGRDYTIDYISGTVTLMGDILTEMTPDSRVSIDYQHKPLVGGGKNSLLGVGANLNLSTNSRINATFLYNSIGAPKYTPRLGEEPVRTMAADVNGSFRFTPDWMTSLVNLLPRVDTDAESFLNLNGEVALSIPNPNVKGEAFVDDMEGVEDSDMIPMGRRAWYEASPPIDSLGMKLPSGAFPEFYWFNVSRELQPELKASRRDLNPGLDPRENSAVSSLFLRPINPAEGEWCGVMTGFAGGGIDLTTSQYLEVWVNDFDVDTLLSSRGGVLHIDFGNIDEDFYLPDSITPEGRNVWNDEDAPPYTWTIEEDTGFPGESCSYPTDFSVDNISSTYLTFPGINCRRGNGYHDSEDMNGNGRLDTLNNYYTFELPLDSEAIIDVQRDFDKIKYADYWDDAAENPLKAWRMYRIDLSKAVLAGPGMSEPRWDAIQHMRIWISDIDQLGDARGAVLEIADIKFVGNRWEFNGIRDLDGGLPAENRDLLQKLILGTINNKDNPSIYNSPYDVMEEEGLTNREQSLLLGYEYFADSTSFQAVKRFPGSGQNFQEYRDLQFFLRSDFASAGCEFYLQLAYDSTSYYEVTVPLPEGDANIWRWINVNLNDLTNLKLQEPDTNGIVRAQIRDNVDPSRVYNAVLSGIPTLFQVKYLFIGLRNATGETIEQGEVWFNDVKLGGVRKDIDHAARTSFSADFGNVLQFSGSWQRTGPEFRTMRQKSGSGVTTSNMNLQGKTAINHFVPTAGFDLPVSVKYSNSKQLPKYIPQSDIEITDDAIREEEKTVNNSYAFTVSLSRRGSSNLLMKNLFDKMRTSFSYSKRGLISPSTRDTTWTMSGNLNYSTNFSKSRGIDLFKGIRWRYWLSNFSFQSSGSRKIRKYYNFASGSLVKRPETRDAQLNTNASMMYEPFESVKIDFDVAEKRNASIDHDFYGIPIGVQTSFNHNLKLQFQPAGQMFLLSEFSPRFQFSSRYNEDLNPNLRQEMDPFGTRNVSAQRNMNVVFDFDLGRYALGLGKKLNILEKEEKPERRTGGRSPFFQPPPGRKEFDERVEQLREQEEKQQEEKAPPRLIEGIDDEVERRRQEEEERQRQIEEAEADRAAGGLDDLATRRPRDLRIEGQETGPADSTAAPADSVAAGPGRDPLIAVKQFLRLVGRFEPLKTSINVDHNSYYQRLYDRSSILYQLGLTDDTGVRGKSGGIEDKPERASDNITFGFRTAVDLTSNIKLDMRLNYGKRKDDYSGRITESDRLTWPSVNMSWSGLERFALLQGLMESSDVTMNFEQTKTKDALREERTTTLSPNWNFTMKNELTMNLSYSYRRTTRIELTQEFWTKSWSVNVNARYNFSGTKGIGLPLPFLSSKKIRFQSTLTTDVNVGYSSTSKYNQPPANSLSVSPTASYKFSKRMQGAIKLTYRRSSGGIYGYINHSVGMHLTADFTF